MTLNPEDVPQVLVDDAVDAWHEAAPALLDDELRQVLAAVLPAFATMLAERVALVSAIACGWRCPACHGKPSSHKYPRYRCGCGHQWDVSRSEHVRRSTTHGVAALLRHVAETGELPAVPDKVARTVSQ